MHENRPLTTAELKWCFAPVVFALAPHAPRLPVVLPLAFVLLMGWRWGAALGLVPLPDRTQRPLLWWLLQALAITAFVAIYFSYPGRLGRDAGVAILTAMAGLKFVELRATRDYYMVCLLAYFLVVTNFLFSQSIPTALYLLGVVLLTTTSLVRLNSPAALPGLDCARMAALMVVESLPLMLSLFFLFPRLPGPLWGVPTESQQATTGLSDEMTIGRITNLGASEEVAFRATFEGPPPRARDLYWRGPVLWETDGRTWRSGLHDLVASRPATAQGPSFRYEVLMEAHGQRWLPALDAVLDTDAQATLGRAQTLLAYAAVKRRQQYTVESAPAHTNLELSSADRALALALPAAAHPRARALAARWRADASSAQGVVDAALAMFAQPPFAYTLTPPALPDDPIDGFLFDTRQGFCEHYAAAFVVLMRAAGIPARVVTGYQGGELNPMGNYLLIRQSDAHAWAEVYLEERGWIRVDPVGAVAPERVSLGINPALASQPVLGVLDRNGGVFQAFQGARQLWDAVNYQWGQWVTGYNAAKQRSLLEAVGMDEFSAQRLVLWLGVAMGVLVSGLAALLLRNPPPRRLPVQALWLRFCARLARAGLARRPAEGPLEFAARVGAVRLDLARDVTEIAQLYSALRYGESAHGLALLKRKVNAFRPREIASRKAATNKETNE